MKWLEIAGNGWKLLEIAEISWRSLKLLEMARTSKYGWNQLEIAGMVGEC